MLKRLTSEVHYAPVDPGGATRVAEQIAALITAPSQHSHDRSRPPRDFPPLASNQGTPLVPPGARLGNVSGTRAGDRSECRRPQDGDCASSTT
jgi:hypothetical protein